MNAPTIRRPRTTTCPACGEPVGLSDCGVPEHRRTRTRREQLDGRCTGRVYIHFPSGGIECEAGMMLTLTEAAELLGLSPDTLRRQAQAGRLKARKLGQLWIVSEREVERYRAEVKR